MKILNCFKQKLKNFPFTKTIAVFTTTCFILSTICSHSIYAATPISNGIPASIDLNTIPKSIIPFNLGRVTDAYYSNSTGDIVINIQDLHSHEQTQRNICSILSILDNKFGIKDIYVEGATGPLNTKWLSDIKDAKTKQQVLNNLLKNGRLSGGEYFAVQSNKNTILKGLEDKELYSQNFNRLNDIYNKKFEIKNYLFILKNIFNKKSEQYYSKENKKINKIVDFYKEGKIKTDKYIELLLQKSQKTDINLSKYKNIINLAQVISSQKSFNQKNLTNEIKDILKELKEKTKYTEYKTLVEKSSNKEQEIDFYYSLLTKANQLNILSNKKYKNTKLFFEYLKQNQNINTINLANEEKIFVQELQNKLAETQAEKEILFLKTNIESLSHYLTNKMTAKEYELFSQNKDEFKLLWKKYIDIDNLVNLTEYFDLVDDFYNNNLERNRIFIKNLLGKKPNKEIDGLKIKSSTINHEDKIIEELAKGKKIHVVITGGFHTYGFNKLLEDENVNYIVITPNITEETAKTDILYENIFNEQYNITNTTFANRPISEIIALLNKGAIKDVRVVGNDVEIEYENRKTYSLKGIQQEVEPSSQILSEEQAKLIADIIIDLQQIKQLKRENARADRENLNTESTQNLEKKLKENLTKITDLSLRTILEDKIKKELPDQVLTKNGIKNKIWYKTLTRLGWITIRESLVAIFEQQDFDNIFMEEILGKILDREESAREKFLQEHENFETDEEVSTQLNNAVTSIIDAMNNVYKIVFGFSRIHFIAQLAAKIVGIQKHKQYNVNIYKSTKNTDFLLTKKAQQHTYQVKFTVYFRLNGILIEYKTGDNFFTTAPTKTKALSNAVRRAAEEILDKNKLERTKLIRLTMFLIRQSLNEKYSNIDKNIIEVQKEQTEEKTEIEKKAEEKKTVFSKKTNKVFTMRNPKSGEYRFHIEIPGLNKSPELTAFQYVYARSPRQAIFELVYQICTATKNGYLKDGIFEGLPLVPENIDKIEKILSQRYQDIKILEILPNTKPNNAPILNDKVTRKQKNRQMKIGEKIYKVVIPDFNEREYSSNESKEFKRITNLTYYQYVVIKPKKGESAHEEEERALEEAVNAIIKAREREEIKGGYYNYVAINRNNKNIILETIKKSGTAKIKEVFEIPDEQTDAADTEEQKTSQETQTNLQNLISQLTNSKNDIELKSAIDLMLNAGFKQDYIENLLYQYLTLREGNIPDEIYSKTAPIKFGTAGVRGIMGEEIDFLDVIIITQAISNVISAIAKKQNIDAKDVKILVGGDSRFLSKQFAEIVSKILAANGINVVISSDDIPSPAISYYTRANGFTLSINITASHNPKEHNGYKITLGDGGQAGTDVTAMIENEIKNIQEKLASNTDHVINIVNDSDKIKPADVKPNFIEAFKKMISKIFAIDKDLNLNKFREKAAKWTIVVDPKNGATKKYYYEILKFFGFNIVMINDTVDPTFGGQKPEPSFENTKQLREKVKTMSEDKLLGISTDVDGDRFAVVDRDGNFITANDIGTILLNFRLKTLLDDLLSEIIAANGNLKKQNEILKNFTNRKIIIPRNCATTHVLDDLAENLVSEYYNKLKDLNLDSQLLNKFKNNTIEVKEVNVGFKYFAQAKHNAEDNGDLFLLGVESSGGISVAEWIYDKCGFLANLMLLFVLVENDNQPKDILNYIYSKISYEPQGLETAIRFREIVEKEGKLNTPEKISTEAKKRQEQLMATLAKLKENENNEEIKNLFTNIDEGLRIKEIRTNDGIKIIFENGTWLLIRPSGTEPIVRIFDETKGNKELSQKLADFVMENGGKILTDKIEKILETKTSPSQTSVKLLDKIIKNSVEALQRLTYSILFKNNTEYTIVADADDLARIKKAELLSKSGIKVNLVLIGDTSLIRETDSRLSTSKGQLAFCLIETPNSNLNVYGYDDKLSEEQVINSQKISEQNALIAMLEHINNESKMSVKILDLPVSLKQDIVITDIEEISTELFTAVGIGKTTLNLFSDALKNKKKKTDDMFIKPSLVASNLSKEQIDNFNLNDINRLAEQGITTIIIDADDILLKEKESTLKEIIQMSHDKGLKVMFNYRFNLKDLSINDFENWILTFNDKFQQFKENGGIDGLQADLSQSGVLANNSDVLSLLSKLSKNINEQNVGSFLSIKMPSDIYPTEFLILCNNEGIKLVADYDSPLVSIGLSNLKTENMIINISADKNGFISLEKISKLFENNKVSMLSLDLPILEAMEESKDFSFKGMSITKFISSIFEITPEGQNIKGINKGRSFVTYRDFVINEDILNTLYSMYKTDNFDIAQINMLIKTNFNDNISKYELKGFIKGLLEATELKKLNAVDISFDKKDYTNLLMETLLDYRISKENSFNKDLSSDIEEILVIDNFSNEFKPKIEEVYNILNGRFDDKIDTVINILSSLKDNQRLNSQERNMVLEALLLLLLGYAKQDIIDMGNLTDDNSIANIKAILRAA